MSIISGRALTVKTFTSCDECRESGQIPLDELPPVLSPKVLLVGPSLKGGGAEKRFRNIATHLFMGRADVAVLTSVEIGCDQLSNKTISLGWNSRLSYVKAIWLLWRRIKQEQYDVLMAFGLFPNVVSIIAILFSSSDTKLVINEITRPKLEALNASGWRTLIHNSLRKWLYGRSTLVTANSIDGLRETCELAGVLVEHGIRVVNVVDSECLYRQSLVDSAVTLPARKYVVCVGRLDYMKRLDTVVDAFCMLNGKIECELVIIGDGEARQALETQVKVLGLQESVMFAGKLENPFPLLKSAAAFVLASEYEGYSNSVLEAMFCDVPVITSFCSSDAREMCEQGAALGYRVGDVAQLSKHISVVVSDEVLSRELVSCAREYCAPHDLEQAIPIYEKVICRVTGYKARECRVASQ